MSGFLLNPYLNNVSLLVYETLSFTSSATLTVTNNNSTSVNIFKTSGSAAWDSHSYTATGYTAPITLEFNKAGVSGDNGVSYAMIGWNIDPLTDASYSSLDHASYPYRTDLYEVYNNNTQVLASGLWDPTKKFYIVYNTDGSIKHYNGSTLLYTGTITAGSTVYVDSSFYAVNATYGGFSNIRAIKKVWNGVNYV